MIVATAVLAGLGLVSGFGLAIAARVFAVETDPRRDDIADILPGANCGGCGFAGCNDFAGGVVVGKATADGCPVGGSELALAIATVMGQELELKERRVAMVHCQGSSDVAPARFLYNGMASCASADLLGGGAKLCGHGCLGFGDCQTACGFGAIELSEGGLARVLRERCSACGLCVEACPKNIIDLVPAAATIHVLCNNTDKGGTARKACKVACIGCKKCEKFYAEGGMVVENFLSRVDYENAPGDAAVIEQCPNETIVQIDDEATRH
jgi:Na+-translocating ferredoxin:NAD+ oxidoreductase subunit B